MTLKNYGKRAARHIGLPLMTAVMALAGLAAMPARAAAPQRIVALGSDVTEIIYALGAEGSLVCDDQTSLYPLAATKLPQVGYLRTLAAEGVLSCRPDLIIASEDAGPPAAMTQLAGTGIPIVRVTNAHQPEAVIAKINVIAKAVGLPERGARLADDFKARLSRIMAEINAGKNHPRVMFLMAHGPGGAMVAGKDTAAGAMLTLAGAQNVADSFHGYKPLTPEAAIALKPDVIIISDQAIQSLGSMAAIRKRPEIAITPAGKSGRIKVIDTLLMLSFGPRTPEALIALSAALKPQPIKPQT